MVGETARTSAQHFQHEMYTDAAFQSRLLRQDYVTGARGLTFALAAYDMKDAPPFSTISYVWGDLTQTKAL